MTQELMYEIRFFDVEVTSDHSRLVTRVNKHDQEYRAFLETLEGIEFGPITFNSHEEFGATFSHSVENREKIETAGYTLMISNQPEPIEKFITVARTVLRN